MFVKVSQEQVSNKKYYVIFLLTSWMDYLLINLWVLRKTQTFNSSVVTIPFFNYSGEMKDR